MARKLKFRVFSFVEKKFLSSYAENGLLFYTNYGRDNQIYRWVALDWFIMAEEREFPVNYAVQQFTGLLDSNNKEIFEGDVLAFKEGDWLRGQDGLDDRLEVFWDVKNSKFGINFFSKHGGEGYTGKSEYLSSYAKKTQIIGNIFENPELLNQ